MPCFLRLRGQIVLQWRLATVVSQGPPSTFSTPQSLPNPPPNFPLLPASLSLPLHPPGISLSWEPFNLYFPSIQLFPHLGLLRALESIRRAPDRSLRYLDYRKQDSWGAFHSRI